jgi:NAD(P)H-hydrate repair Nnr-like enzyme with NAD(P)H-hydrate dehydratase domain
VNATKLMLVKGAMDYIMRTDVSEPNILFIEAIDGIGDKIAGMVSAFVYAGLDSLQAAVLAARGNHIAGKLA